MNRSSSESASESESEPSAIDLAIADYLQARDMQPNIDRSEFLSRYPDDLRVELADFIDNELNAQGLMQPQALVVDLEQTVEYRSSQPSALLGSTKSGIPTIPDLSPYRLITFLGEGGMGRVYEAVDSSGQHVAVKVLNQHWSKNPESMERFKLEGALAGTINHPRCVFVRAVDEVNGQPFIVMELMSGKTLRDLVAHSGPFSTNEAVAKILDVIDGLQEAHQRGVIHRDIKPANCFLEPSGRVKLGDFGLARSLQQESDLTQSGSFIGTPLFASPEQIRGEPLDYRTDIYSVCATLYYLLTGHAPFGQYSSTQVIARIVSDDPVPIRNFNPALPKLLEQVLQKGLSRNRDRRFQDLNELRNALEPFVSGRQAIAQLARRVAAYGFDTCLLTMALFGLASLQGDHLVDPSAQTLWTIVLYHGIAWGYFIFWEGWFSATPGKLALQLRIVDSQTGERASFRQIVLRAAVYLVISTEIPSLALLVCHDVGPGIQVAIQLLVTIGGMALLLITLRSKHGSRLLHDALSNTIVVAGHNATKPVRLLPTTPLRQLSTTSAAGWPAQFGAYEVNGVIWQTDQQALLSARDARLNRDVWLRIDREKQAELSQIERYQPRPARLRYLSHGEQGTLHWTAYVAPSGAPLRYWVTPEQPLSWREARLILEQLIEEFRQSRDDYAPLRLTSLDQLWLDAQCRIAITEWSLNPPVMDTHSHVPEQHALNGSAPAHLRRSEQIFATEAMRMSLTGKSRPLDATTIDRTSNAPLTTKPSAISSPIADAVEAPLPLHARRLLDQLLIPSADSATDFDRLQTQLRESASRPWVVSSTMRLWMLGISMLTLLAFLGAMLSISRVGNQAALMRLEDHWLETSALQAIANDGTQFKQWQETLGDSAIGKNITSTEMLASLLSYQEKCRSAIQLRWKHAGVVQRQILAGGILAQVVEHADDLQFMREPGNELALRLVAGPPRIGDQLITAAALKSRWQAVQAGNVNFSLNRRWAVLTIVQTPFVGLILWSTIARGGLPFLLLGVRIVRQRGAPASRWLIAWRSLLTWLPLMLLNGVIVAIDMYLPEFGWLATMLHLGMFGLLLVYAAIALRWPDCGPHDWLAGTRLVPA